MDARCKNCSKHLHWRAQRGVRLSDHKCKCGGKFEKVWYQRKDGIDPLGLDTQKGPFGNYHFVIVNTKGQEFTYSKETNS
jgi:hypothetical protein